MQTDNPNTQQPSNSALRRTRARLLAMGSAAAILVVGLGAFALLPQTHPTRIADTAAPVQVAANDTHATPRMLENSSPFSFADLVERVSPAVVTITSETMTTEADSDEQQENLPAPFRDLFNQFNQQHPQKPHKAISAGSGFIIDKTGLIVTNNHVVDNGKKITVKLPDGRSFEAKLMGTDPATDIALLKVKSDKPLPTVEFGDDRQLRVGDWVVAVGNPFGLSNSVTAGIVSSIGRDIGAGNYNDFIQIDAPINRGNSGGPTFDLRGQVIGMNSMIFSPSGGSVGIGFAIPANLAREVVAQLRQYGIAKRGWIGVRIQQVTSEIAEGLGLASTQGALVAGVTPGGPAAKAGLMNGDLITGFDGKPVADDRALPRMVADTPIGKTVGIDVLRKNRKASLRITVAKLADETPEKPVKAPPAPPAKAKSRLSQLGLSVGALDGEARGKYKISGAVQGVLVVAVDPASPAGEKNLREGDVIVEVQSQKVKTPEEVSSRVEADAKSGRKVELMLINRDGDLRYVGLKLN